MYCKKCHTLLEESSSMCPNCYYDNTLEYQNEQTQEFKAIKIEGGGVSRPKIKIRPITIVIIFVIISLTLILVYMIKDRKELKNKDEITTTVITTVENDKLTTFSFQNIELKYGTSFGSSTNTIFYKNNSNINIEISTISEEEFQNQFNDEEALDKKLGETDTKTIAFDNYYTHIFKYNDLNYCIKVNFINDDEVYDANAQMEISKILTSLKLK